MNSEFKYWIKNNKVVIYLVGGFLILLITLLFFQPKDEEELQEEFSYKAEEMQNVEIDLEKYFSLIDLDSSQSTEGSQYILNYTLYLKNPYMSDIDYQEKIEDFIDLVKFKYNYKAKKPRVSSITIEVYDRKLLADRHVFPRDYVSYALAEVSKDDTTDLASLETSEDITQFMISYTNTKAYTTPIDYELYEIYTTYKAPDNSVPPITDDEFKLLLKILDIAILLDNVEISQIDKATDLLLLWEYGLYDSPKTESYEYTLIKSLLVDDVTNLFEQLKVYNSDTFEMYASNKTFSQSQYKNKLTLKYPRLVYYIQTNKIVATDLEAKKELIRLDNTNALGTEDIYTDTKPYLELFTEEAIEKLEANNVEANAENISEYLDTNEIKKPEGYSEGSDSLDVETNEKDNSDEKETTKKEDSKSKDKDKDVDAFSDDNLE